jgi:hypothetical protein
MFPHPPFGHPLPFEVTGEGKNVVALEVIISMT